MRLAEQRHFPAILSEQLRAIGAQVELASGNLAAARRWADSIAPWIAEIADYRYEPVALALARVRIAEQRIDPTSSVLPAICELLDQLLVDAEAKARNRSVVEILILRALAFDAQGDRGSARAALERALQLAQTAGYVRLFLDEGAALVGLLRDAHAHSGAQSYVATLLSAAGELAVRHATATSRRPRRTTYRTRTRGIAPPGRRPIQCRHRACARGHGWYGEKPR